MRIALAAVLALPLAFAAVPASATVTTYTSTSTFTAAAPNQTVDTYPTGPNGTAITNQNGVNYGANATLSSNGSWSGATAFWVASTGGALTLTFKSLLTGFAALFGDMLTASPYTTNATTLTLNFLNGTTNVGSTTLNVTTGALTFAGYVSTLAFNSVAITGGGASNSVVVDNVTRVPEPASMALLGTGLLGLIAARRRRRV